MFQVGVVAGVRRSRRSCANSVRRDQGLAAYPAIVSRTAPPQSGMALAPRARRASRPLPDGPSRAGAERCLAVRNLPFSTSPAPPHGRHDADLMVPLALPSPPGVTSHSPAADFLYLAWACCAARPSRGEGSGPPIQAPRIRAIKLRTSNSSSPS